MATQVPERDPAPEDLLGRLPLKSLTALCGGLAVFGVSDQADAMVADGGYKRAAPQTGKSQASTPPKSAAPKKAPASPPVSPPTRTDASDGYAGMEASRARTPAPTGSPSSGSSGTSGSGAPSRSSGARAPQTGSSSSGTSGSGVGKAISKAARKASNGAHGASASAPKRASRPAAAAPDPAPKRPNRPPPGTKLGPGGELYPAPQPTSDPAPPPQTRSPKRSARRAVRRAARQVTRAVDQVTDTVSGESGDERGSRPPSPLPSRPPEGLRRGPGGELLPIPRAHSPKPEPTSKREDPYPGGPNRGPELDNPFLLPGFGLAPFGTLGDGDSLSVEGGCGGTTLEPAKCFGKPLGEDSTKKRPDGEPRKTDPSDERTRSPDADDGKDGGRRKTRIGPYLGWDVVGSTSASRGEPQVRRNGQEHQSLGVRARVERRGAGGIDLRIFGADISFNDARSIDYELDVRSERAERIAEGEKPPDHYRPRSLDRGESILLRDTQSEGSGGTASVGPVRGGGSEESGESKTAGVRRVGRDSVRISVGSESYVRGSMQAGFGIPEVNASASNYEEFKESEESSIVLDLSTPEGRRQYESFLGSGRMPAPRGPGRRDAMTAGGYHWSEGQDLSLSGGPASATDGNSGHSQSERTEESVSERDQRRSVTFNHEWGDTNLEQVSRTRRDGTSAPDTTEITVSDADTDAIAEALEARGVTDVPDLGDEANVRVDFTTAELEALQERVIDGLKDEDDDRTHEEFSADERNRVMPYDERPDDTHMLSPGGDTYLAAAKTPEDVGKEIQLIGQPGRTDGGHYFIESLNALNEEYGTAGLGQITVFDDDGSSYVLGKDFCGQLVHRPPPAG